MSATVVTIKNNGAGTITFPGLVIKAGKTAYLTKVEWERLISKVANPGGYADIAVTDLRNYDADVASDAEVAAVTGVLSNLTTTTKTTLVAAVNEVDGHADAADVAIGKIDDLDTTATNLVAAVNEVKVVADASATKLNALDVAATAVSALKVNYTTGDLDVEAEVISALNTTNTALNAVLTAMKAIVA